MGEVTPAELAEWLAESPEEARPRMRGLDVTFVLKATKAGCFYWSDESSDDFDAAPDATVNTVEALALWFTAETMWLWGRSHWIEPGGGSHYYVCWGRDENESHHITAASPYHALAAAVRRARAEEGKA